LGVGESPDEEVIYLPGDHPYQPDQSNGPGDALWHALRRVRGDIVVWADPGISGFEPRHIYGLIGPLLSYQKFNLAIGFFTEGEENEAHPVEDALNELSIRPLLGGFFPRLSGVINPTSLIGAARRDHLERLALFTESGLMPGLLIDTLSRSGLMSMVQVDLGAPAASVCAISPQRTSYEIMTVLLRRVEERAQIHLTKLFNSAVKTVHKGGGVYFLRVSHSHSPVRELPPQLYTPGYFRHTF
jgi:glucosyl-3-phosphoglycerate synthase